MLPSGSSAVALIAITVYEICWSLPLCFVTLLRAEVSKEVDSGRTAGDAVLPKVSGQTVAIGI